MSDLWNAMECRFIGCQNIEHSLYIHYICQYYLYLPFFPVIYWFPAGEIKPIHQQLSDVGQFSYAALCAIALHTQFHEETDRYVVWLIV